MNFACTEEQDLLRDSVIRFLRDRIDLGALLARGPGPGTRYDAALWQEICDLGWPGNVVPERYGGLGLGLVDCVVVTEELGRALVPCPYLGSYAGMLALLEAGSEAQKSRLLPAAVAGEARFALAWSEHPASEDPRHIDTAIVDGRVSGAKQYVVAAEDATHLVVTARDRTAAPALFLVDRNHSGVRVEALRWMDITRRVATVRFDAVDCEPLALSFEEAWDRIADRVLLALASENAGGAEAALRMTVACAMERVQFGKPIAAFQAIKHRCADMLIQVESAKALSYYAAWALTTGAAEGAVAVAMARSHPSDAYRDCTAEALQMHGAIGFTWELPLHLHYKRARANAVMFGSPARLRDRVIELVTAA